MDMERVLQAPIFSKVELTVALFQGLGDDKLGEVQYRLEKMKCQMSKAKEGGADLLVFPELFTTGYSLSHDRVRELAEDKSGNIFQQLSRHAVESGIAVLYGYPEVVEEENGSRVYHNSVQFIDRAGTSLSNYRKSHLWLNEGNIEGIYTPGSSLDVFEFHGVKIGLLICYDVEFSEAVRTLSLAGAQLVLVPTACDMMGYPASSELIIPTRAYENSIYVMYVNYCGGNFDGHSRFCDPKGRSLINAGTKEGISMATVEIDNKTSRYLIDRRPELYKEC